VLVLVLVLGLVLCAVCLLCDACLGCNNQCSAAFLYYRNHLSDFGS